MKINKISLLFIPLLVVISACNGKQEEVEPTPKKEELTLKLVYDPEIAPVAKWIQSQYEEFEPLTNGRKVQLKLLEKRGVVAAEEIASGKLKTDVWLSPSTALTDYANFNVRNLGAKQVDCTGLFSTPMIAAAKQSTKSFLKAENNTINLSRFLEEDTKSLGLFSINHTLPELSQSGLSALIELLHIATTENSGMLQPKILDQATVKKNLSKFESYASTYKESAADILEWIAKSPISTHPLAIVSEQELIQHNLKNTTSSRAELVSLYPVEGSYWMSYNICRSDVDWIDQATISAYKQLVTFLTSEDAQKYILSLGFRPVRISTLSAPFTKALGVDPKLPTKLLLPPQGALITDLLKAWPSLKRPAATTFIVDTSGSMEGEDLISVKNNLLIAVDKMSNEDVAALITFSASAKVDLEFSNNKRKLKDKISSLTAASDSALYDAINLGLQSLSFSKFPNHRKNIILITDSKDSGSSISFSVLQESLQNTLRHHQVNLHIVAIDRSDLQIEPLKNLATLSGGNLIQTNSAALYNVLTMLLKQL
ncbi:MAG: vWA domain-containing protein [Bdellovibrionota bacterium]|jgi:uncharacterized protein YegL